MADDRTKRGGSDRDRVAAGQDYEVDHFARKHGITREEAQALIKRHGNNRETLDAEAAKLKQA
jgi:hypothetical protein